jgi:hypothetical protein
MAGTSLKGREEAGTDGNGREEAGTDGKGREETRSAARGPPLNGCGEDAKIAKADEAARGLHPWSPS